MNQLATNEDRLVEMSVLGEVSAPVSRGYWRVDPDGRPAILPGVGGITYNCKVGDSALDWQVDHVEPCVSVKTDDKAKNTALNTLACIGNVGRVVSGDAKGDEGVVTGKHGGIEHVISEETVAEYGPGLTSRMTSRVGRIEPVVDEQANLAHYLEIGRMRPNQPQED